MSVVLRCPSCGTRQGHAGECEACFEGEVRYFCTSHDEGIWLDTDVCSRCGARFGDAPKKPPAPRTPRVTIRPPEFRPPVRHPAPEPRLDADFGARATRDPEPEGPLEPEVLPRRPSLGDLLEKLSEGRARAGRRYEAEVPRAPRARRPELPIAGCLLRLVGVGVLLVVAAIIFLLLLFGGFVIG